MPGIAATAAFAVLVALGVWQVERKAWKENLIATLAARMSASPSPISLRDEWQELVPAADEFRRVRMRVQFDPKREARVYSGGAGLRDDVKAPGYFAFAPARLADGSTVVINRGHVDNPNPDAPLKPIAVPEGAVDVVGALRWPEAPGWFVTPYSERQDLWFVRDHRAMARRNGWGDVAPFYIEMASPAPVGGVPRPGTLTVKLRNDHFGYALTWFGLAAVLVGVFGFWAVRRRHEARGV
ncbi:MAG: SURF1 family protein [Xanthobacteraceae bacterium]|nr:SURF1 family protein [Xanthobacteraceae bacterium]